MAPSEKPAHLEELVERVLVVLSRDLDPRVGAVDVDERADVADGVLPERVGRAAPLVIGHREAEAVRVGVRLFERHARPADVHEPLRVVHHERPQLEAELLAVAQRQVVDARDAHAAGLGVETGREVPERVDPSADSVLGLEHEGVVALAFQLVGGDEAREPAADDDHPLARPGPGLEPLLRDPQIGRRLGDVGEDLRLAVAVVRGRHVVSSRRCGVKNGFHTSARRSSMSLCVGRLC